MRGAAQAQCAGTHLAAEMTSENRSRGNASVYLDFESALICIAARVPMKRLNKTHP
jgi:hypothetical protein